METIRKVVSTALYEFGWVYIVLFKVATES